MTNGPSAVAVELEPVSITDEMVEEWEGEWSTLSLRDRTEYGSREAYVEEKARDHARSVLMSEQGHHRLHNRFDGYEVTYDE